MKKGPAVFDVVFLVIQLLLFVLYFWQPDFVTDGLVNLAKVIGAIPMVIGAVMVVWALVMLQNVFSVFASPKEGGKLITSGIFRYVRHPIYAGIMMLAVGYSIFELDMVKIVLALLITLFFHFKAGYEERRLLKVYPGYAAYKMRTGKFIPNFLRQTVSRMAEEAKGEDVKVTHPPPRAQDPEPPLTRGDG